MSFKSKLGTVAALAALITFQSVVTESASASGSFTVAGLHRSPAPVTSIPMDNVRTFGATGDGVTDDTAAIQNAANDAANRHIGVFFPPGTYLHAEAITFNGVAVTGSGNASYLVAANNSISCGVVLTGTAPSLQNMVVSTAGLNAGLFPNVLVNNATSFTLANDTFVEGTGYTAVKIATSSVGTVNACYFDGTGSSDVGVVIEGSQNVSIVSNLIQNEYIGIYVDAANPSQAIALLSNTIGSVSYPTQYIGIEADEVGNLDVAQNTIQMASAATISTAISLNLDDSLSCSNNSTWGGKYGITVNGPGPSNNVVTQNAIHNCGQWGVLCVNAQSYAAIRVTSNVFGECGLTDTGGSTSNAVIYVTGVNATGPNTFVQNNSYQGHFNGLIYYVSCSFNSPHIPGANVTGNTVTQAVGLPNSI
jgi:hypothetical protein